MLDTEPLALADVVMIHPNRIEDHRGYFSELFNVDEFTRVIGKRVDFVQDNESLSVEAGTLRGLHFQLPPFAQGKLVRAAAGSLLDVVVDIRAGSSTYGHHVAVELDHRTGRQLWVPPGMAHGFCTLEPNTVIAYKVSAFYDRSSDRSLSWCDPRLGIDWPLPTDQLTLSDKDAEAPVLSELERVGDVFV